MADKDLAIANISGTSASIAVSQACFSACELSQSSRTVKLVRYGPRFQKGKPRQRGDRKEPEFSYLVGVEEGFSPRLSGPRLRATQPLFP